MTESRNTVLIGKIVNWPNKELDDAAWRDAGHGPVIAVLDGMCLLVSKPARSGDPVPPYLHVLRIDEPGLNFFDSEAEHDKWLAWIMNDDNKEPVVQLAPRRK